MEAADVPAVLEVVDVEVDGGGEGSEKVGEVDKHAHPRREAQFTLKNMRKCTKLQSFLSIHALKVLEQ